MLEIQKIITFSPRIESFLIFAFITKNFRGAFYKKNVIVAEKYPWNLKRLIPTQEKVWDVIEAYKVHYTKYFLKFTELIYLVNDDHHTG